ncbi:hypothetical protein ACFE04_000201 [Oxalis oulophora]
MSPTKKRMPTPKTSSDDSSSESESDGVPMAPAPVIAESSSESESESDGEPMAPAPPIIVGGLGDSLTNDDSDEEGTKKDDSDEEGVKQAAAKKRERTEVSNGNGKHKGKKLKQTESSKGGGRGEEEDRDRKPLFQRLFTEKDEITLLQGIIDYTANIGNDPFTRIAAFYDYIKQSLQCDATEAQLHYKMKRMRKKYINISNRKGIKAGKEPNFTKHHERILFDLSKKIWPSIIANNNIVDVDNTTKIDLEKKHKDLNIAQLTLFIEQTKLALKRAELALEAAAHST